MNEIKTIKLQLASVPSNLPAWGDWNEQANWRLRLGEFDAALSILRVALSETEDVNGRAALTATLARTLCVSNRKSLAYQLLSEFDQCAISDPLILAKFQHTKANVLDESGEYGKALIELAGASAYFEVAGHPDRAEVAANTASVYVKIGKPEKAHPELDKAESYFRSISDQVALAQTLETRARAYLAENRCDEAYAAIKESRSYLTDEAPLILESLATEVQILDRMKSIAERERTRLALLLSAGNYKAAGRLLDITGTAVKNRVKADPTLNAFESGSHTAVASMDDALEVRP